MSKKVKLGHINTNKVSEKNFKLNKNSFLAATISLALISSACAPKAEPKLGYAQPMQERIVLGSMMIDESIVEKVDAKLDTDSFVSESHRILFDTMIDMNKDQEDITPFSVIKEIKEDGNEDKVDGYIVAETVNMIVGIDKKGQPVYDNVDVMKIANTEEYVSYLFATTNAAMDINKYIDEVENRVYLQEAVDAFTQPKTLIKTKPKK